jgi:hypothetical protein
MADDRPKRNDREHQKRRARAAVLLALEGLDHVERIAALEVVLRERYEAYQARQREAAL